MESHSYYNNARKTQPKNFRGNQGDRKKIKTDDSSFRTRHSFPQSESGDKERRQCNEFSCAPEGSQSSVHKSLKNRVFHKGFTNNLCGGGYTSRQFYGPSVNHNKNVPHEHPNSSFGANSSKHSGYKNNNVKHSRSNMQERCHEQATLQSYQQAEELHLPRNQIVQSYCEDVSDIPIKPPQIQHSLLIYSGSMPCEQKPPVQQMYPKYHQQFRSSETYDMYVNRPDHDIGQGRFFRDEDDLPPRFRKKYREHIQERVQECEDIKQKYEQLLKEVKMKKAVGDVPASNGPNAIHASSVSSCTSDNKQQLATSDCTKPAFQENEMQPVAVSSSSEMENQIYHLTAGQSQGGAKTLAHGFKACAVSLTSDEVNSSLQGSVANSGPLVKTEASKDHQTVNVQHQKSNKDQRNFMYNEGGHSRVIGGAHAETNTNKTFSSKHIKRENQLSRNVSNHSVGKPSFSGQKILNQSSISNTLHHSTTHHVNHSENTRPLFSTKMYDEGTHLKENVRRPRKNPSSRQTFPHKHTEEHHDCLAFDSVNTVLDQQYNFNATNSQKRDVSFKEHHLKNVRTSSKETVENFNCASSIDKCAVGKEVHLVSSGPCVEMEQKNTEETAWDRHSDYNSEHQNSGTRQKFEAINVCKLKSSSIQDHSSESTADEMENQDTIFFNDQLSVDSEPSTENRITRNLVKVQVSGDVHQLDYWRNFLEKTLPHIKFEIRVDYRTNNMLNITFSDKTDANKAWYILKEVKGKNDGNPFIKIVKRPRYNFYRNFRNKNAKILHGCLRDVESLCTRASGIHESKTAVIKRELNIAENSHDKDSVLAIQGKLKELEEMQNVLFRYAEAKKKVMNSEVDKPDMDGHSVYSNLLQMKKEFIHEYMCFKAGLPIYAKKEAIIDLVTQNQVSVLVAETGSGKSTQLVQYLLQNGFGKDGIIVCTQPRKIAAVSIAKYISGQMGSPIGATVGYEVGLDKKTGRNTKIVYMTDYVLLRKCVNNRSLKGISCVVVDEAHERSLFTDLLLAIIKKCLPTRRDIRIIITSATINPSVFKDYFSLSSKAVLSVPGRTFPVEVKWQKTDVFVGWNFLEGCVELACKIHKEYSEGDILVFLTSPQETEEALNLCKEALKGSENLPVLFSLHGKQDMDDQTKVFSPTPEGHRKIVFATNAAETSVTIPGIKFVIDSGMVKEKQYIAEKNRNALAVGFISRSSAEQRKGRAGRTQAGICYRLYSERNYARDMPERTAPEILRINLQLALLRILEFNMQPEDFDFVESPSKKSITLALNSLEFLGVVKNKHFTDLGKQLTKLPLEPQLGKLVISGAEEGVGYEASIIASIAAISGMVFYRNEDNRVTADKKKIRFCREEGDFLTFLDVFKEWYSTQREWKSKWCAENCINAKAMRIAHNTAAELIQILRSELQIIVRKDFKPPSVLHSKYEKILFECFSENICVFSGHKKTGYLSPFETGSLFIHPSSSLCYLDSKIHNFVIFSSVLKTSRSFLLNVTPIKESTIVSAYQKGVFPFQIDMLKQLQINPAKIYPVGESILIREILGRQGSKLHDIEQQIKSYTKTDAFQIDVNVQKGEILIYIVQSHHSTVAKLINAVIQETRCQMAKEEEIFRIAECASSCFAVTSGGIVNDVLLPGEFREVIVEGFHKPLGADKVIRKLNDFGTLQSYKEIEEHGSPQILATYVKARDAQRAVEDLQKLKLFDISSKVSYAKLSDKSLPLFRLQVTWPRFPCLGTGWISFLSLTDCIEASGILTNKSFYVGDRYITFTPTKNSEKVLHMKNLPSFAEVQDITRALKDHLPEYIQLKIVHLVRRDWSRASEEELNSIKKQLFHMFGQYTPSSKLVINLRSPNASEILWTALVYFENFEDGEKALNCLTGEHKHKAKIGEYKLQIRPILKSSLHCDMQILKLVEKNLHFLMRYSKNEGICTEFDIKPAASKKTALITFSCNDIKSLDKVRQEIRKLIKGMTLPCPGEDPALYSRIFSKSGEEYLKDVEQRTQTVINVNPLRKTITIFGLDKAVSSAKSLISCYISSSNDEQVKVFNLCGKKIPSGFLKALRQKYGFRLFGLIQKFNLREADIDFVSRTLTVKCSEKTMKMVEQCLAELCVEVKKSSTGNVSSDVETCPVCLDVITSDLFRLNNCGHAFCRECLLLQIESKIIPLICSMQGCEKPLFIEDINKLLVGNEELKKEFSQAALKNFIAKNNSVRYCPMPNCSMVYRVTSTSNAEFHCPSCENDICTRCQAFYHHGMTCDMFQRTRVDEHYPLKVWMQGDTENRKSCPKCSAAIEKFDGCNHVHCTQCDTHFCWLCLKAFSRSEQVYDHMPFCEKAS